MRVLALLLLSACRVYEPPCPCRESNAGGGQPSPTTAEEVEKVLR